MATDGAWEVTDGGWRVTDGGWRVTDGGWRVTDGGWGRGHTRRHWIPRWSFQCTGSANRVPLPLSFSVPVPLSRGLMDSAEVILTARPYRGIDASFVEEAAAGLRRHSGAIARILRIALQRARGTQTEHHPERAFPRVGHASASEPPSPVDAAHGRGATVVPVLTCGAAAAGGRLVAAREINIRLAWGTAIHDLRHFQGGAESNGFHRRDGDEESGITSK